MHNEEENVSRIVKEAEDVLSSMVPDWEIIIVESGSTDNTWEKINEVRKGSERIRAFRQTKREGMGSALRLGYEKSSKDLLFHLEADSPFEIGYFKKALPILFENDCVIGFRVGSRKQGFKWSYRNSGGMVMIRWAYHVGYNLLLRLFLGLVVRDANFSFKIFKRKDMRRLNLISKGWFIDAEILLELKRSGILPIEMPIEYKDRTAGSSTVNVLTPFHMLYEMVRYMWKNRKIK